MTRVCKLCQKADHAFYVSPSCEKQRQDAWVKGAGFFTFSRFNHLSDLATRKDPQPTAAEQSQWSLFTNGTGGIDKATQDKIGALMSKWDEEDATRGRND